MPNVNAPFGFRPVRHLAGGQIRQNEYPIASGLASNIFNGDLVVLKNDGKLDKAAAGDITIIGVFAGVRWTDADGSARFEKYWPTGQVTQGAQDAVALVYDDPHTVFEVQCLTGTVFAQTHVGNNADINAGAGNTLTGRSAHSIDISAAAAATAQIRILGISKAVNNDYGDSARVEAMINEHQLRVTAGI